LRPTNLRKITRLPYFATSRETDPPQSRKEDVEPPPLIGRERAALPFVRRIYYHFGNIPEQST
jgi:hypothetical protein